MYYVFINASKVPESEKTIERRGNDG